MLSQISRLHPCKFFFKIPAETFKYLAGQLKINEAVIPTYQRIRTKQTQIQEISALYGLPQTGKSRLGRVGENGWPQRALETRQNQVFLLSSAIEKLYQDKISPTGFERFRNALF